jgi:hypothetical protein
MPTSKRGVWNYNVNVFTSDRVGKGRKCISFEVCQATPVGTMGGGDVESVPVRTLDREIIRE